MLGGMCLGFPSWLGSEWPGGGAGLLSARRLDLAVQGLDAALVDEDGVGIVRHHCRLLHLCGAGGSQARGGWRGSSGPECGSWGNIVRGCEPQEIDECNGENVLRRFRSKKKLKDGKILREPRKPPPNIQTPSPLLADQRRL